MSKKFTKRRRKLLPLVLAALVVLVCGPYFVSRVRSPGRQIRVRSSVEETRVSAEAASQIRLLSFNIAHGRGATEGNWEGTVAEKRKRIMDIADVIGNSQADVVILNEVDFCSTWSGHQNQAEAIALRAGFPHWVEQRNLDFRLIYGSWKFGNAVLSRFPIVAAEALRFPALRSSEKFFAGCKQGVICTIQLSESQQVRVLAVHLEHRSEDVRVACAKLITEVAASSELPLFAVGDFNSTPSSFPHSQRTAQHENAMDVLLQSNQFDSTWRAQPTQKEMTYPSHSPTQAIDWILIPRGCRFISHRTIPSHLSDHLPLVADVQLPIEPE